MGTLEGKVEEDCNVWEDFNIKEALKAALLTDEEMSKGRESWKDLDDPMFEGAKLWDLKDLLDHDAENEEEEEDDEENEVCNENNKSCENLRRSSRIKQKCPKSN